MPAAASITNAIELLPQNVIGKRATLPAAYATWMVMFTDALPGPGTPLDRNSADERSVYNWYGPSLITENSIDIGDPGAEQISISEAIDAVGRVLYAVRTAVTENFITANQETSILAQYNAAWA